MAKSDKLEDWTDEEIKELKKLWESPVGKKYIKRIEDLKKNLLNVCMYSSDRDEVARYVAIACGYDATLDDIDALVNSKKEEKEGAAKKK